MGVARGVSCVGGEETMNWNVIYEICFPNKSIRKFSHFKELIFLERKYFDNKHEKIEIYHTNTSYGV